MGNIQNQTHSEFTVGELIKDKPFLNFSLNHTLYDVVNCMREQNTYVALILEHDNLAGLLTEHGILLYLLSWFSNPRQPRNKSSKVFNILKAQDVMIKDPETVDANISVEDAYKRLIKNESRFIAVMRDSKPIGILEYTELISYIEKKNRKELEMKDMMLSYLMHNENYGCL